MTIPVTTNGLLDEPTTPIFTPPAAPTEYRRGDLIAPVDAVANLYDVDKPTQTVAGQMDSLLSKDNPYMKRAESKGLQVANSRGLLNSSIAAEASQAAAIDAALPIAQQDASTYFSQANTNQKAENDFGLINKDNEWKGHLKEVDFQNDASMQAQKDIAAFDKAHLGELGANYRAELANQFNLEELGQKDKAAMTNLLSKTMNTYEQRYLEIMTDPSLDEGGKNAALDFLDRNVKSVMESGAALTGVEVDMGNIGLEEYNRNDLKYTNPELAAVATENAKSTAQDFYKRIQEGDTDLEKELKDAGIDTSSPQTMEEQLEESFQAAARSAATKAGLTELGKQTFKGTPITGIPEIYNAVTTAYNTAIAKEKAAHQAKMDTAMPDTYSDYGETSSVDNSAAGGYDGYGSGSSGENNSSNDAGRGGGDGNDNDSGAGGGSGSSGSESDGGANGGEDGGNSDGNNW